MIVPPFYITPLFAGAYAEVIADHPLFLRTNVHGLIRVDARYTTNSRGVVNFGTETTMAGLAQSLKKAFADIDGLLDAEGRSLGSRYGISMDVFNNGTPVGSTEEGSFPLCQSLFRHPDDKPVDVLELYPRSFRGIELNKALMTQFAAKVRALVTANEFPEPMRLELNSESGVGDEIAGFHRDDETDHIIADSTGWMDDFFKTHEYVCREPITGLLTGRVTAKEFWEAMTTASGGALPALNRSPAGTTFQIGRAPLNNQITAAVRSFSNVGYLRAATLANRRPWKAEFPSCLMAEYALNTDSVAGPVRWRPDGTVPSATDGRTAQHQGYFGPYDLQCPDIYSAGNIEWRGDDPSGATFGLGTGWGTNQNWSSFTGISTGVSRFKQTVLKGLHISNMAAMAAANPRKKVSPYMAAAPYSSAEFNVAELAEIIIGGMSNGSLHSVTWFVPYLGNDTDYRTQFDNIEAVAALIADEVA